MAKPAGGTGLDTGGAYYSYLTAAKGAAWGMLEGSGGTSADSSGNGHTLTLDASLTWGTNGAGDAIINGSGAASSQAAAVTSPISFASGTSWSFAFRMRTTVTATYESFFGGSTSYVAGNDSNFGLYSDTAGNSFVFTGATDWQTDADWLIVLDHPGLKVHLFRNGTEIAGSPQTIATGDSAFTFADLASAHGSGLSAFPLAGTMTHGFLMDGLVGTATDAAYFHNTPYGVFASSPPPPPAATPSPYYYLEHVARVGPGAA